MDQVVLIIVIIIIILIVIWIWNSWSTTEGFKNTGGSYAGRNSRMRLYGDETYPNVDKLGRLDNTFGNDTIYSQLPIAPMRQTIPNHNYSDNLAYEVNGDIDNASHNLFYDPEDYVTDKNKDVEDMKDLMGIDRERYAILRDNVNAAKSRIASRWKDEMKYTESNPFNTIPLGANLDKGYTMLDPIQWFRAWDRPPVCHTDKQCPVCPVAPSGTDEYLQFDARDNITGPEGINVSYVRNILNSERPRTNGGTGEFVQNWQPKYSAGEIRQQLRAQGLGKLGSADRGRFASPGQSMASA